MFSLSRRNEGAFSGNLLCPICKSQANKLIERLTPFRFRYQCKKCGQKFQYDISGRSAHPYEPFKSKQLFKEILERHKNGKTR